MSSINSLLSLGKRALLAQQVGMQTTGNNISNAQNPNYSRQNVQFSDDQYIQYGNFYIGAGVNIENISRSRDQLYDVKYWQENASMSRWETGSKYNNLIEGVYNDLTGTGLSQKLDEFWNSWMELGNYPQDISQRRNLYSKTESLINTFHNIDSQLHSISNQAKNELQNSISEINKITGEIANLNVKISSSATGGGVNNTVLDQRDALIGELSKYIDVRVNQHDDGTVTIHSNHMMIIDKANSYQFGFDLKSIDGQERVSLSLFEEVVEPPNGRIKSLVDTINLIVPDNLQKTDDVAQVLVQNVNEIHLTNYNTEGNSGIEFFDQSNITAGSIQLSNDIKNNIKNIAVSKNSQAGDGRGAIDIENIRDRLLLNDHSTTINGSFQAVINQAGERSKSSAQSYDNQLNVVNMLENQRQAIMGVSIDEEMVNMIKFQTAFGAASKLIVSVDEMMQTILNMV